MKKYFSYRGRIDRVQFALTFFVALSGLVALMLAGKEVLFDVILPLEPGLTKTLYSVFVYGFEALFLLAFSWVLSAAWAKRLHDVGVTGWYQLILLVPFMKYLMLVVFFLPGTEAANKYGEKA
jgi:uncharacterized membrane protein YhaH (DUF805 family)